MPETSLQKNNLRRHFRQLRMSINIQEQTDAALQAAINFLSIPIDQTDIISAYYPLSNEISPLPIFKELSKRKITTALPVITNKNKPLIFRIWQEQDNLCEDELFGTKQPTKNAKQVTPTIMIIPLLAFDQNANRLGYGGGFFDRTIANLKNENSHLITIGLAYALQQTDHLPTNNHDQKLDYVITQNQVIKFK